MIDDTQIIAIAHAFRAWERAQDCYIRRLTVTVSGIQTEAYRNGGKHAPVDRLTYFVEDVLEVIRKIRTIHNPSEITILHLKDPDRYSVWIRDELYGNSYRRYLTEGVA